jgi:hypothetical protein
MPTKHALADGIHSDMANIEIDWEVKGSIYPLESVSKMLRVIAEKGRDDSGTFWCWDGRVSSLRY